MGGVFNTVNASLYHYAGNNPIRYTDPTGQWIDNEDGTFTAEDGDTLWGLFGNEWQEKSEYNGDPAKLQVGNIVGKKRENHDVWNSVRATNNAVINKEPNSKAYYQSMFGAGIALVGGGNFEVGFVWDTLGNKGIAVSGDLGCGVSADINIKGLKAFGNLLLSNIISDFQSYTCINGTIYDFEGTYATVKVHVLGGVTTDLNNPNNSNFSVELSVGGGTFWGGTKVFGF